MNHPIESQRIFMGIDLGGTHIKLGLVREGQLISIRHVDTSGFDGPTDAFAFAKHFADQELRKHGHRFEQLQAVGLAAAGVLDDSAAMLREVVNLPSWADVSLSDAIEAEFRRPVAVLNDANAAALGEYMARGLSNQSLALLTLGTGIGCGLVVSGEPFRGDGGCAGELGHIVIDADESARQCRCGRRGHLEAYAGAAGVVQTAKEFLLHNPDSSLARPDAELTPLVIAGAAEEGDEVASAVVRQTAQYIGHSIAVLQHVINPSVIVLGGAMTFGGVQTFTGRSFLDGIRECAAYQSLAQVNKRQDIDFAILGNEAGVLGAARNAQTMMSAAYVG